MKYFNNTYKQILETLIKETDIKIVCKVESRALTQSVNDVKQCGLHLHTFLDSKHFHSWGTLQHKGSISEVYKLIRLFVEANIHNGVEKFVYKAKRIDPKDFINLFYQEIDKFKDSVEYWEVYIEDITGIDIVGFASDLFNAKRATHSGEEDDISNW